MEMIVAHSPTSLDLDVLAIELPVRMNLDGAIVRVVATHDHAPAIANHVEPLRNGVRCAAGLDDDIHAAAARCATHGLEPVARGHVERKSRRRAHAQCERETIIRRTDRDHLSRARQRRERHDRLAHRTGTEYGDGFPELELGHVYRVQRGDKPASAADERLGRKRWRQLDQLDARLHPDRLGPSAEQSLARPVRNSVHFARRAARRLARDETLVAVIAGLVHIEKGDGVALANRVAMNVAEPATGCLDDAHRHMTRNDRKGHVQLSMVQMHVGAADLRVQRTEQRSARLQFRRRKLFDDERSVGCGHEYCGVLHGMAGESWDGLPLKWQLSRSDD